MKPASLRTQGQLVAEFLAGSWRDTQDPLEISVSELDQITTLLYNSGGTGLAWWRIHESELKNTPSGELLHQGYRLQALQTPIMEDRIVSAVRLLTAAGVEPILFKGWAAARFYSHRTLRAYGDIDLVVRPAEYSTARNVLKREADGTWWVDLHQGLPELDDRSIEGVFERSQTIALKDLPIRVLSDEDHLALLAIHLFKHGAWRPSWLCDIAALVEAVPVNFDVQICFGPRRRQRVWIASAIALAQKLLGANTSKVPLDRYAKELPEWLVDAVLKQWGGLFQADHLPIQPRRIMAPSFRSPLRMLREIRERWPDPIVATFNLRGQPNNFPRLPYQVGAFAARAGQYFIDHLRAT